MHIKRSYSYSKKQEMTSRRNTFCFVVGGTQERVKALFYPLAVFYYNFKEAKREAKDIPDVDPLAFKSLLDYIYMDEEPKIDENNWAPTLYVSEKYDLLRLKDKCLSFVETNCGYDNASFYYSQSRIHQVTALVPRISSILVENADKSLTSGSILLVENNEILKDILSMDELDEITIYKAALNWATAQIKDKKEDEFMKEVIPKGILNEEELFAIFKQKI